MSNCKLNWVPNMARSPSLAFPAPRWGLMARQRLSPRPGLCSRSDRASGKLGETFRGNRVSACTARRAEYRAVIQGPRRGRRGAEREIVREGIEERLPVA